MWPFRELWGINREERKRVRNYLRIVWEENNDDIYEIGDDFTHGQVKHERDLILDVSQKWEKKHP